MELHKIKRRRFWLMAAGAIGLQFAWVAAATARRASGPPEMRTLELSLNEVLSLATLMPPIIAAILASRLATVDTEERMGLLLTALGQRESTRFVGKLSLGSIVLVLGQVLLVAYVALMGPGMGLKTTPAYQEALWPALIVVAAASVAAVAVQLTLAVCVHKQGVGLGVGALAAFLCSGLPPYHLAPLGWLIPWGVAGAASPIDYAPTLRAGTVLLVSRPWLNSALAVIVAIVWVVLANLVIVYKESHR